MNMRKTFAAAAAVIVMTGSSAPALAFDCDDDPAVVAANLQALAFELRCNLADGDEGYDPNNLGNWDKNNPIWEKRREPSCEVHSRLAAQLYEVREFTDDCSGRPRRSCKDRPPQNDNNLVAGAGGDVANGKYEAAITKLDSFIADVMKSRLNSAFDPDVTSAHMLAMELIGEAEGAQICIADFLP